LIPAERRPFGPLVGPSRRRFVTLDEKQTRPKDKFDLEEGTVTISVPSVLSRDSYQDFADRMQLLLRGLKRRSDAEEALKE
jgi:hypothetical protein